MDTVDVIVVGGGISGLGVADQCLERGLSVRLLERTTLCQGASGNSLRIIHGGLRYLQHGNLIRSLRSIRAQGELMARFPRAIRPLSCILPLERHGLKSRFPARCGTALYRMLGAIAGRSLRAQVVNLDHNYPDSLRALASNGALEWDDAVLVEPALIVSELREQITRRGGEILENYTLERVVLGESDVVVEGSSGAIHARVIVNCAGSEIYTVRDRVTPVPNFPRVAWCAACNVVLPQRLPSNHGLAVSGPRGRQFFLVPRSEGVAIGTWYIPHHRSAPTGDHLQEFCDALNGAQTLMEVRPELIQSVEWGVLPMAANGDLIGSERVFASRRYVEVLSTKWTTFLPQARDVVAAVHVVLGSG